MKGNIMPDKKCKKKDCECKCPKGEKPKFAPTDPFVEEEAFFDISNYNKKKEDEEKGE